MREIIKRAATMTLYFLKGTAVVSVVLEFVQLIKVAFIVLQGKKILNVILIKPSKYDTQGFVVRDRFGVLPGNTLATLYSLILDVQNKALLGHEFQIVMRVYDETVHKIRPGLITWLAKRFGAKSLVMLVGVQTNQFPRAADLASAFQKKGIQTMIGGFHISGALAMFPQDGQEVNQRAFQELSLQRLVDCGTSLFAGEAENGRMLVVLQEFLAGQLKLIYNYLAFPPDLTTEPFPKPIPRMAGYFVVPYHNTIESCRGCPFNCSFCAVCNVQGKKMRPRAVADYQETIRQNYFRQGISSYFDTADNSSRDPLWPARHRALADLRDCEGIALQFIRQIDARCHKIPGFLESLAGFSAQAFVGFESVNPANLKDVKKGHNRVAEFAEFVTACQANDVTVQGSFIVGLRHDTKASVAQDLQIIMDLGLGLAFFYSFIPVPGSEDHRQLFSNGCWLDPDLNKYDGFSGAVMEHPLMSATEWQEAYQGAWRTFYSVENMVSILRRMPKEYYWRNFSNLMWCKYAVEVIQRHPMVTGLFTVRDRRSRREGFPRLSCLQFQLFKLRKNYQTFRKLVNLVLELTEVWLQTRERNPLEQKLAELAAKKHPGQWFTLKIGELKALYQSLGGKVPGGLKLYFQRITYSNTRSDIQQYWRSVKRNLKRGRIWILFRWQLIKTAVGDTILVFNFLLTMLRTWRTN